MLFNQNILIATQQIKKQEKRIQDVLENEINHILDILL